MFFPNTNIRYINLIIIFYFTLPQYNYSQNKYEFDFDSKWNWEDLINKVVIINPELIKSVDSLKNEISIIDARIILKELSELSTLKLISQISNTVLSDSKINKYGWDTVLAKSFDSLSANEDFDGLLSLAIRLSKLRNLLVNNEFIFNDRSYLSQPLRDFKKKIDINFDYTGADAVLDFFVNTEIDMNRIYETNPYGIVLENKYLNDISQSDLQNYLSESSRKDTLFSIYKWINPSSFWNMGGVSVYKSNFRDVVNNLKQNESNIKFDLEKNLSGYLPENILFDVDLMLLFGDKGPGWISGENKIGISLEYFGDDYNYLIRFIQNQIFILAEKQIRLPVEQFAVDSHDKKFVNVLSEILTNGTANYISPVGTETRPWYLLEKDFTLFNRTFKNIYKKNNAHIADSLIAFGFSGDAPFNTMATQMAYIIETTLGRNALVESIKLGPVFFFSKYIDAYKEYPDKIRKVFTFNEKLEKKIYDLKKIFPQDIIKDALALKEYESDTAKLGKMVTDFLKKYDRYDNDNLLKILSGQIFLEAGQFNKAYESYFSGISDNANKGILAGELGELFSQNGSVNEALMFYDFSIDNSPDDPLAYTKRGEYLYTNGQYDKARSDFEKALAINSRLYIAKAYLEKIHSQ